jgi:hypothetical protein
MPNLTECKRCGALAAFVEPTRADFWNAPLGVCESCRDRERQPQGEAVRLFTPAPAQMPGQLGFGVSAENPGT